MRKLPADLAHALAAEYVLGTLRGPARRRFEALAASDPGTAAILRQWEAHLAPLAERIEAVDPPARVWARIEERIGAQPPAASSFWSSLGFWRGFGLVAGGLASVLLAAFLWLAQGPRGEPLFVAVLNSPESEPRMVVSMHQPDVLRVRMVRPWKENRDMSLELWVLPKEGAPRSLGVIPNAMGDTIIRITSADPRVQGAQAIAVTMEPRGGSPSHAPTGPMVCSGPIAPVRKA
ncbi:MAG TPA: anti-sigma factor [Usitatibacter sp.]|nr:anti-sigma factor [Usitatibacter sp.]